MKCSRSPFQINKLLFIVALVWGISCPLSAQIYEFDTIPIKIKPLGVEDFIKATQTDTSLYRAFKNLRIFNHKEYSKVAVWDKEGGEKALMKRTSSHYNRNNYAWIVIENEEVKGKYYNKNKEHRYFTAEMFDHTFFPKDTIFASNVVINPYRQKDTKGESTVDKYYEKLKTFIFSPGTGVDGVPIIGDKLNIFSEEMRPLYDFTLEKVTLHDTIPCYKFTCAKKANVSENKVVIQNLETYYDRRTLKIISRKYHIKDKNILYDFNIKMEVQLMLIDNEYFPTLVKYFGDWDAAFKKRERMGFTIETELK